MSFWERVALHCEEEYSIHIDWEERFFICPECGEPIYECDWDVDELGACPICEFCW